MKLKRGTYPGASEFAFFNATIEEMSIEEMRSLLQCILHRASPGELNARVVFGELAIAERNARELG